MSDKSLYIHDFIKDIPASLRERLFHQGRTTERFVGKKGIDLANSSQILMAGIKGGKPFAAIRYGGSEISCLNGHEKIRLGLAKTYKESARWAMKVRAGFYPTDDAHLNEYCDTLLSKVGTADVFAILGLHMEDYFYQIYTPHAQVITNWALEPLLGTWTPCLKGKKVLVVNAFADEIAFQYQRREKLFPQEPDLLPEFELHVLQAPMTMGESTDYRFPSFMRSLEEIEARIKTIDFDVALLGCGAYGALLSLYCKSLGKIALQTGGATQTLFGIIGKRWEKRAHVQSRINDYWIRPDPSKKPKGYEKIDNGAYW